jgi:nucleoside-diphosphate-sugar epimerase
MAGDGRGRRQPVHAEDLARACLAVIETLATVGKTYEVPGGETLTYREMVQRIARGLGRQPRLLAVPRPLLAALLAVARRTRRHGHLTPEMAARMDRDLVFDTTRAKRDFGYAPRPFRAPGGHP